MEKNVGEYGHWIRFENRLPTDGEAILVSNSIIVAAVEFCLEDYKKHRLFHSHEFTGYEWDWDFVGESITDWMPLPKPCMSNQERDAVIDIAKGM